MNEVLSSESELFQQGNQEIVVDMNNWRSAKKHAILATRGLLPCIGVAIYDSRNQVGHMGHWSEPEQEPGPVDAMLQSALQTDTRPQQLRAWLRGGAADPEDQEYIASVAAARTFMSHRLTEAGIISCETCWSEQPLSVDMWLHCANGNFMSTARPANFE